MSVQNNEDLCAGCGCCMDACEVGAIEFKEEEIKAWINEDECIECENCIPMCPNVALSMQ